MNFYVSVKYYEYILYTIQSIKNGDPFNFLFFPFSLSRVKKAVLNKHYSLQFLFLNFRVMFQNRNHET